MQPFSVTLANGSSFNVVHKIYGRKRSIKLVFFKIRRKQTLIAYTVQTQEQQPVNYTVYKIKDSGAWQSGDAVSDGRLSWKDRQITRDIKSAIDQHESSLGPHAYLELF